MSPEEINKFCEGSFVDLLNISFKVFREGHVEAVMPVTPSLYQPMGVVHGGALISLAETVGSAGSFLLADPQKYNILGASVNSHHLAPARSGHLHAVARIISRSKTKHIWDVEISDEQGRLVSISRVSNSIKPRKAGGDDPNQ